MTLDDNVLAYLRVVPCAGPAQIAADLQAMGNSAAKPSLVREALDRLLAQGAVQLRGAVCRDAGRPDMGGMTW